MSESDTKAPLVQEETTVQPRKKEPRYLWRSGCMELDSRFVIFAAQFLISLLILVFCATKLTRLDTCEAQSLYGNIILTLMGVWMPSPIA